MLKAWKVVGLATGVLLAAVALTACGSSSSSSSSGGSTNSVSTTAETASKTTASSEESCGTVPTKPPADPEGLLAKFPTSVKKAFNLYTQPVLKSAWTDFKPSHPGPYKVAVSALGLSDPFSEEFLEGLKKFQSESSLVKEIKVVSSNGDVQTQIRQMQQLIHEEMDAIIFFPGSPPADAAVEKEAGEAGIPLIGPLQASGNQWMTGVFGNEFLKGATLMQALAPVMGNKGSLVKMLGFAGLESTEVLMEGVDSVLKQCPEIEVVGELEGQYSPSTAKTQTLQFLAAHPSDINGAIQVSGMATGMIEAFQQTGRSVPPIGDNGATPGALAYWKENQGSYNGVALGLQVPALSEATWTAAEGLLEGRGLKINEIVWEPPLVTEENLDEWVEPGWSLQTPLIYARGPEGSAYPKGYLEQFFVKPSK